MNPSDSSTEQHRERQRLFLSWLFVAMLFIGAGAIAASSFVAANAVQSMKVPASERAFEQLVNSNRELQDGHRALLETLVATQKEPFAHKNDERLKRTLDEYTRAFEQRSASHKAVMEQFRAEVTKPPEGAAMWVQMLTGGAVLGLLAFLGLTRLSTIDKEIADTRKDLLSTTRSLIEDSTIRIKSELKLEVQNSLKEASELATQEVEKVAKAAQEATTSIQTTADELRAEAEQQKLEFNVLSSSIDELPTKYPFLASAESRDQIQGIELLSSVEQAHELAVKLTNENELRAAAAALRQIIDKKLPGNADDFHNAHAQANNLNDSELGLEIVECGIERFPANADMAADKVLSLTDVRSPTEAIQFGEEWLARNTAVTRSWRFGVFLARAYEAAGLSKELREKSRRMFDAEVASHPKEAKLWSMYARQERPVDTARAYELLDAGLTHCPWNQELRFVQAEFLMEDGRFEEAKAALAKAIQSDFQDQFQPGVNALAVLSHYAQAHEGTGELAEAERIYQVVLSHPEARGHLRRFAELRLLMLAALQGKPVPQSTGSSSDLLHAFLQHMQQNGSGDDEAIDITNAD